MKKIVLSILILLSFNAYSFEYKGVKSGMTIEEVNAVILSTMEEQATGSYSITWQSAKIWLPDLAPELSSVYFQFDHKDRLFRLSIEMDAPKNPIKEIGYEAAYKEVCETITNKVTRGGVNCIFLDDDLFAEAVAYYKEMRLKNL